MLPNGVADDLLQLPLRGQLGARELEGIGQLLLRYAATLVGIVEPEGNCKEQSAFHHVWQPDADCMPTVWLPPSEGIMDAQDGICSEVPQDACELQHYEIWEYC